jgi:hypothetical protein
VKNENLVCGNYRKTIAGKETDREIDVPDFHFFSVNFSLSTTDIEERIHLNTFQQTNTKLSFNKTSQNKE